MRSNRTTYCLRLILVMAGTGGVQKSGEFVEERGNDGTVINRIRAFERRRAFYFNDIVTRHWKETGIIGSGDSSRHEQLLLKQGHGHFGRRSCVADLKRDIVGIR